MVSNDEKLSKFNIAINHYAEEQRQKIEHEVEVFKQQELEEAETEVLTEAYRMIQKEMVEMRGNITREMAHREMDARRELLAKRQKITDEVFEKAKQELVGFTKTDAYLAMLEKNARELSSVFQGSSSRLARLAQNIAAAVTDNGTVIFLKEEDLKYQKQIEKAFGAPCKFQIDGDIQIGGLRAQNFQMGIVADETLDSMLEDQREWFEENSGMAVV